MKDLMGMMKNLGALQEKFQAIQDEIARTEVEGQSGAGLVRVTLTGKGGLQKISVDPSLLKPDEAEILEDLIVAAHADAKTKAERAVQERMQALTGGLPLPPGFKLPF